MSEAPGGPGRRRGCGPGRSWLFGMVATVAGCATGGGAGAPASLESRIEARIDASPLDQLHWGILAVDGETGRVLYARNEGHHFVPASNMKILATAAAIRTLGADYRYRTTLWSSGPPDRDGTLEGPLILAASGDPTLSRRFHPRPASPLDALADSVAAAGVRRVRGPLVVDASSWDSTTVEGTWMVDDLAWSWGATGGAFAVDEGVVEVVVRGGAAPGDPAQVQWWPALPRTRFRAAITTVPQGARFRYEPGLEGGTVVLRGRAPVGAVDTARFAMREPVRMAAELLAAALARRGVALEGGFRVDWGRGEETDGDTVGSAGPPEGAWILASLESPPMVEIVEAVLEPSQNWIAEQVVRTLGAVQGARGSWAEGLRVVEETLVRDMAVDTLDLSLRDGSGLSAYNLVTPRAVVAILRAMRASPEGDAWRLALAEPGEEDSTLEERLTELSGRVFAKTGTITHVNSLSGYVVTDSGREIVFAILTNASGLPSGTVRGAIDDVVRALAAR